MKLRWKHYTVLAVVVISFICSWLIAGRLFWWNVVGSVPTVLLLVLPIVVALLAIKEKRKLFYFLSSFILLLGLLPRIDINLHAFSASPETDDPGAIKIMGWNTELWDQIDENDNIYDFIKQQNQDIYVLQEYEYITEDWEPYLIDRSKELRENFPDYQILTEDQFVVISKYPILDYQLSASKQVLLVHLNVNGQPLSIVNVHLRPHVDLGNGPLSPIFWNYVKERYQIRTQGLDEIQQFVTQETDKSLIVTGDFNTTLLMGGLETLRSELSDAVQHSREIVPTTWESKDFVPSSWKENGIFWWRIDHFLYNKKVDVLSYDTRKDTKLSDHKAMLIQLKLKP